LLPPPWWGQFNLVGATFLVDEAYALSAKAEVAPTDGGAGDLSWLRPPPVRLGSALARAESATFEAYAWKLWTDWRGDPETVAQIARAGQWALEDLGVDPIDTSITVHVGSDWERFSEPWQVVGELTQQAARRFDAALITQAGRAGTGPAIRVRIANGRLPGADWFSNAVAVEVTDRDPAGRETAAAVRDRISLAVQRGKKWRRSPVGGEGAAELEPAENASRAAGDPPSRLERRTSLKAGIGGTYLAILAAFYVTYPSEGDVLQRIWLLVFGALVVLVAVGAAVLWFLSGVELGRSTRLLRLTSGGKAVVLAAGGAALPIVVKWALATFLGVKVG